MAAKSDKYFWLKLKDNFFTSKRIKKLRKLAGGDTYVIIYLKMQLIAMKHDGIIQYTGLENTFSEELALDIDEEVDNVQVTLSYLVSTGLAETSDNVNFFFPYAVENVGSESSSAERVRAFREREKEKEKVAALQCNTDVTRCNTEREKEKEKDTDSEIKKEPTVIGTEPQASPVLTIPLNDGTEYAISAEYADEMQKLYPAVDVLQQFRSMRAWCLNNPERRKTKRGVKAFINRWLSSEQDKSAAKTQQNRKVTTFMDL